MVILATQGLRVFEGYFLLPQTNVQPILMQRRRPETLKLEVWR